MRPCLKKSNIMLTRFLLAIASVCLVATANAQGAQTPQNCYPRVSYAIKLANTLGEVKQVSGIELRGNLMELYVSPKTGTWTLVLVLPSGLACKIGSGSEFKIEPYSNKIW